MNIQNITTLHAAEFPALSSVTDFKAVAEPVYMGNHKEAGAHEICELGQVIRREDTGAALGLVGNRYGIAQNAGLYEMLTNAARDTLPAHALRGLELKEVASYGGAYTRFELAFPAMKVGIKQRNSETELKFRVGISNTFDGNGSVRVFAGAYDQVCENGMCIGELVKQLARHTAGFKPGQFSKFIAEEMELYLVRAREYQRWADMSISQSQAENVLKSAGLSERRVNTMLDQFQVESINRGATVWALYSALTFYASHNSERFGVRNSQDITRGSNNVGATLEQREREVNKFIASDSWAQLTGVAA